MKIHSVCYSHAKRNSQKIQKKFLLMINFVLQNHDPAEVLRLWHNLVWSICDQFLLRPIDGEYGSPPKPLFFSGIQKILNSSLECFLETLPIWCYTSCNFPPHLFAMEASASLAYFIRKNSTSDRNTMLNTAIILSNFSISSFSSVFSHNGKFDFRFGSWEISCAKHSPNNNIWILWNISAPDSNCLHKWLGERNEASFHTNTEIPGRQRDVFKSKGLFSTINISSRIGPIFLNFAKTVNIVSNLSHQNVNYGPAIF